MEDTYWDMRWNVGNIATANQLNRHTRQAEPVCLTPALTVQGLKQTQLAGDCLIDEDRQTIRLFLPVAFVNDMDVKYADGMTFVKVGIIGQKIKAAKILPIATFVMPMEDTYIEFSVSANDTIVDTQPDVHYNKATGVLYLTYKVREEHKLVPLYKIDIKKE